MPSYEVILQGFNGATDKTDHLILWVKAPSIERVSQCINNAREIYEFFYVDSIYEDAFDFEIL
jgi:hypothetical protein